MPDLYDEAFVDSLRLDQTSAKAARTADLLRRGWTHRQIGWRVRNARLLRPYRGIYLPSLAGYLDELRGLQQNLPPEAAFAMTTAATLHGFGVLADPKVHVSVPVGAPVPQIRGVSAHQTNRPAQDFVSVHGLRCVPARRCAADLARALSRLDALPVLDAAVRSGAVAKEALAAEIVGHAGMRGVRQARSLVRLVDPASPCRQESQLRLILVDGGLPRPEAQFAVCDECGVVRYRVDLAYAHQKVGVEYDGASHLTRDRIRADRARHNWLEERGWAMRYFTDRDIYRTPDRIVEIVARALNPRSSPIKEKLT